MTAKNSTYSTRDGLVDPGPIIRVTLFGTFALTDNGGRDITPVARKAKALLAILSLAQNGRRSKSWIQDRLWSSRPQQQGRSSLRQTLSKLRRHLEEAVGNPVIEAVGDDLAVDLKCIWVDAKHGTPPSHLDLLEGIEVDDPEFEFWLSEERAYWYARLSEAPTPEPNRIVPALPLCPTIELCQLETVGIDPELTTVAQAVDLELAVAFGALAGTFKIYTNSGKDKGKGFLRLSGKVRRGSQCLRIHFQLHMSDGTVAWSDNFDMSEGLDLELQGHIARAVVEAIREELNDGAWTGPWSLMDCKASAWILFQKGRTHEAKAGRVDLARAMQCYRRALTEDPNLEQARIALGFCLTDGLRLCWHSDPEPARAEALALADVIARRVPDNPYGLAFRAFCHCIEQDFEGAIKMMQTAVIRMPRSPEMTSYLGSIHLSACDLKRAEMGFRNALELVPFPPLFTRTNLALVQLLQGLTNDATETINPVLRSEPNSVRAIIVRIVLLIRSGKMTVAQDEAKHLRLLDPNFEANKWRAPNSFANPSFHGEIAEELKLAGL